MCCLKYSALVDMVNGTPATEIFPDNIEEGQKYGLVKITGRMVTPDTYLDYYVEGY